MVKVMMGIKGSGKTKQLIELVHEAKKNEQGDIVYIEKSSKLIHDIPHTVRLIDASQYEFDGYKFLKGFISGLHSANYDITHIFIDSILKILGKEYDSDTDEFIEWCDSFSKNENVTFTITVSDDIDKATPAIKKYF
ncbi:MAG: hypothetical protein FWD44_08565 [Oscillospiraceae bacterium]|nr:hypothetical protein [Oscillospiraceae bacterium]